MWLRSWLNSLNRRSADTPSHRTNATARRRIQARRLLLEGLEDRRLLAFDLAATYPVASYPSEIVAADFNGDGHLDLATANSGNNTVSVLLGNANGTFQPAISSPSGNSPTSLAVGDFNGDGNLDLVTTRGDYGNADVRILLGNSDGSFQSPVRIDPRFDLSGLPQDSEYNYTNVGHSLAVGDFNADGKLDVGVLSDFVAWDYWGRYSLTEGYVAVLLGTGTGTFGTPLWSYIGGASGSPPAVADFNGDGKLDIAAVSGYGDISVGLGNGNGTFGYPGWYYSDNYYYGRPAVVVAADVNNDGKADLVALGGTSSDSVDVLLGDGLGSFGSRQTYFADPQPNSLKAGDFNGDGAIDLITTNSYAGTVSVLLGTGTGAFQTPVTDTVSSPWRVAVGDFNGDGRLDAASISGSSAVSVLLNDGSWPAVSQSIISINDVTVIEGNSGTVNATFTVSLSAASSQTVTVYYYTSAWDSATSGSDYQATSGTLTFAPGETSKTITVLVNGDRLGERNESFWLLLSNPTNAVLPIGTRGIGTIVDDEPTVSINHVLGIDPLTVVEGDSGTVPAVFTVTLSAPSDQEITVGYYTSTGNTNDIIAASGTLRFLPGETSQTITVHVVGDLIHEPREAFSVILTNSPNAYIVSGNGYCYIEDNDPAPTLTISDVTKKEGDNGTTRFDFQVKLSAPLDYWTYFSFATADGTATAGVDYMAKSGTVYLEPWKTTATISIDVIGDRTKEANETFFVNISGAAAIVIADGQGQGTILDDDGGSTVSIGIGNATAIEGNAGTTAMTFTVTLSAASDVPVTVQYATADGTATAGSDYQAASDTITFAPGETQKTISIAVLGDQLVEPNETFTVNLSNPSGALIADGTGVGTIVNDDSGTPSEAPLITISNASVKEGRNGNTFFTFTVTLSAPSTTQVKVNYATADGTATAGEDYNAAAGTLSFAPGETTKTITIKVKGDQKKEADETFAVNLSGAINASIAGGTGLGTILNDD